MTPSPPEARLREFLAKARKEHYWNEAHAAMYDLEEMQKGYEVELRELQEARKTDEALAVSALKQKDDRIRGLQETLRDQRRRWNRHSTRLTMAGVNASGRDMDDAVNAIDAVLAVSSEEPG